MSIDELHPNDLAFLAKTEFIPALSKQIGESTRERIDLSISVEPGQYFGLACRTVRDVGKLYGAAMNVELHDFALSKEPFVEEDFENTIKRRGSVVWLVPENSKKLEFLATMEGSVVAAGFGVDYDYFHSIYLALHPAAKEFIEKRLSNGSTYELTMNTKPIQHLAETIGVDLPHSRAADGTKFVWEIRGEITIDSKIISHPAEMHLGTPLEFFYMDMPFYQAKKAL